MKNTFFALYALLTIISLSACNAFQNDVNIDLDEYERQLYVECYLEQGQPYRLLLSETQSYFDDFSQIPFVNNAVVQIVHNGDTITLQPAPTDPNSPLGFVPYFNDRFSKFYNYAAPDICPVDYSGNFELIVSDPLGRTATATTRFLPPVQLDSLAARFQSNGKAAFFMYFVDDASMTNYYRPVFQQNSIDSLPFQDFNVDDTRFLNGENVIFGSRPEWEEGDTLIGSIYHIDKAYYDYKESVDASIQSNGNPFAQPGRIISNVSGNKSMGIFTFLSVYRDTIIVQQ